MKYEQKILAYMDRFEDKYGIPSVLALAIDVVILAVGAYLFLQTGILLTALGFVFVMASLAGLLNKLAHGGDE